MISSAGVCSSTTGRVLFPSWPRKQSLETVEESSHSREHLLSVDGRCTIKRFEPSLRGGGDIEPVVYRDVVIAHCRSIQGTSPPVPMKNGTAILLGPVRLFLPDALFHGQRSNGCRKDTRIVMFQRGVFLVPCTSLHCHDPKCVGSTHMQHHRSVSEHGYCSLLRHISSLALYITGSVHLMISLAL